MCFGGVVAYEVARQLEAQGEKVATVAVFDGALPSGIQIDKVGRLTDYVRIVVTQPQRIREGVRKNLERLGWRRPAKPATAPLAPASKIDVLIDGPEADAEVARFASSITGIQGRLVIFRALVQDVPRWMSFAPHLGWQALSERLVTCDVSASHLGLLQEPHVQIVAKTMTDAMAAEEPAGEKSVERTAASAASAASG